MENETLRPAWVEISLGNLDYNIKRIQEKAGPDKKIIGILKADGYGHGAAATANVLRQNGIRTFGVATLQEAVALREFDAKAEIIILGLTPDQYAEVLVEYGLTPVICSYENAAAFSRKAGRAGKTLSGLIAVDTGMGRIGYLSDDPAAVGEIRRIAGLSHFQISGLFSHLATADAADKTYALTQNQRFRDFCKALKDAGVSVPMHTLASSAALMELPSTHYDAVRPGIILYGCYPSHEVDKSRLSLKPAMAVKARILFLKTVPPGSSISYGRVFTTRRESRIATIGLGYADGYPRLYTAKARVIVNGAFAPVAGAICMDQCMVDVTDVPGAAVGDEVIVMGTDGVHTILADDIADATGTINYEIVCGFGKRLPKVYVE